MSDLLGIGASGVTAYRSALSVVGDNIVNAETAGYARRQVVLREGGVNASTSILYRDGIGAGGVDRAAVQRSWDDFRAADSRLAIANAASAEVRVRWLGAVEGTLDDGPTGVGQSMAGVFAAGSTLAADPGNTFGRRAFLNAIDATAGAFRSTADGLARLSVGIGAEARTTVQAANNDIAALARLNIALRRAGTGTSSHTQLSDERDRLLDDLAARMEIKVALGDDGSATVTLPRAGGLTLVDAQGARPALLGVVQADDGRLAIDVTTGDTTSSVTVAGGLGSLVDTAATVADRRAQLDAMAVDFATKLNDWSAAGTDAAGAPGTALLACDADAAAATIAPTLANRDPATVAAAATVVTTIDNGDGTNTDTSVTTANGNLLNLPTLRGAGSPERAWATMVSAQAQSLSSARSGEATASARRDAALASRDEVAGVDLDREAADLLRFQQAYNGSAKIIQVARETLQTVLDILR